MIDPDTTDPLWRLLYTSRNTCPIIAEQGYEAVARLAEHSAERNSQSGVTGCLLFIEGQFVQVLEGGLSEVEQIFERICCDLRHTNVALIDLVAVPNRFFPHWKMAFLNDLTGDLDGLEEIPFLVGVNASQAVDRMRELVGVRAAFRRVEEAFA